MQKGQLMQDPILLLGNGYTIHSLAVCLLEAKQEVYLFTSAVEEAYSAINAHIADRLEESGISIDITNRLHIFSGKDYPTNCAMAIALTAEDLVLKRQIINELEAVLPETCPISINAEAISLTELQKSTKQAGRIFIFNWTDPVHSTRFLEIVLNEDSNKALADIIFRHAASCWKKDPYIVKNKGIRSRLIAALAREAFYLVENGFASADDIDRACRNDAGFYLPFAGNCRYMDLMGTYAYAVVMKDLNPELADNASLPDFYIDILKDGGAGMENGKGFYEYTDEEILNWQESFRKFSYQIEKLIDRYPFGFNKDQSTQ